MRRHQPLVAQTPTDPISVVTVIGKRAERARSHRPRSLTIATTPNRPHRARDTSSPARSTVGALEHLVDGRVDASSINRGSR